jgi:hypothetical protein
MKGGEIVSIGPKREALSSAALSRLFDCSVETVIRAGRFHSLSAGTKEGENAAG